MGIKDYIGANEKILMIFGISGRYIATILMWWSLFLGGVAYFFRENILLMKLTLSLLALVYFWYLIQYFSSTYFITDQKIYKKRGFLFRKVTAAKKTEIDDMIISQGIFERFVYDTGILKFNTPGSAGFEIVLPKVASPYETKQRISELWSTN